MSTPQARAAILRNDYYEKRIKPMVSTGNRQLDEKRANSLRYARSLDAYHHGKTVGLVSLDHKGPPTMDEIDSLVGG
jgi:hypothetical protein